MQAFESGRVAVVTGAASGIGLSACKRFAERGMRVCMVDLDGERLAAAAGSLPGGGAAMHVRADVADRAALEDLQKRVHDELGEVAVLMNNAACFKREGALGDAANWREVLGVNLQGVVDGCQVFVPAMIEQGTPCAVINTGSKQGITMPPGNAVYNVSKAAVKAYTEALQHELRNLEGCQVQAHLLVPGWTTTGRREHQPGAWLPEQVVDFMLESIERGDFYILCPDGQVTRAMDDKRIQWTAGDMIENRPPLSRWHPDYAEAFAAFMKEA